METLKDLLQKADLYKQKLSSASALSFAMDELKSLDDNFRIDFIYTSNALEGNTITLSETKMLLENEFTMKEHLQKDCNEILGYGTAYDFMLKLARQQDINITEEIMKTMHQLFYEKIDIKQAGQYRTDLVYVSNTEYAPPSAKDIPQLMNHLADQIRCSRFSLHPIELAAMAQKRLLDIHPFLNGNGQIARLLMNLILVNSGYVVVSIPLVRNKDYLNALYTSRKLYDMEPFSIFIGKCVIKREEDYCRLLNL